jgi:branched-chain amino acid transport system ATP-binding protein
MLVVRNISSGYGKKQVLFGLSLQVSDNELVLLSGGNGSGKSTVLKCIFGLLPIWNIDGKVIYNGMDITRLPTSSRVKEGIVYIPQKFNYFESLTVDENLEVSGANYSNKIMKERKRVVYELPYLFEYRKRLPFDLSGGERQLLALGIGLMHKPKLILLDEVFAGLDKSNTEIMLGELKKLRKLGIEFLMIEHNNDCKTLVDRQITMYLGEIKNCEK